MLTDYGTDEKRQYWHDLYREPESNQIKFSTSESSMAEMAAYGLFAGCLPSGRPNVNKTRPYACLHIVSVCTFLNHSILWHAS